MYTVLCITVFELVSFAQMSLLAIRFEAHTRLLQHMGMRRFAHAHRWTPHVTAGLYSVAGDAA